MKTIVVLLITFYVSKAELPQEFIDEEWANFKGSLKHRIFNPAEEKFRKEIFTKNLEIIEDHNTRFEKGLETYEMGVNRFSDRTDEEMSMLTGLNITSNEPDPIVTLEVDPSSLRRVIIPSSLDWRRKGKVTPVKNQGRCGSCWAFAANGALEAQYKIRRGQTVILSEQQLVDCIPPANNCRTGGSSIGAYNYIKRNGGIQYSTDYPYVAANNPCRYNRSKPKVTLRGYGSVARNNEKALRRAVATQGPVVVYIHVDDTWGRYRNGVYYNRNCRGNLNHAVVVVGYGRESGQDYWLVKNSWGTTFGQGGYIKMARNKGNNCGIATFGYYPIL